MNRDAEVRPTCRGRSLRWDVVASLAFALSAGFPADAMPPSGACCLDNGDCVVAAESDCDASGSTWMGLDSVCSSDLCLGPCFFSTVTGQDCDLIILDQCGFGGSAKGCEAMGGNFGGAGETCTSATGACCLDVGCIEMHRTLCHAAGGRWHAGQGCSPSLCGGACCVLGSACVDSDHYLANPNQLPLSRCQCESVFGGVFQGESTCCNDVGIDCQQSTGACCMQSSIASMECVEGVTEFQCAYDRGQFQGNDTRCSSTICPRGPCPGIEPCCEFHRSPGCSDPECCATVCRIDPACCFVDNLNVPEWGPICARIAAQMCGQGASYCPAPQDFDANLRVDLKDYAVFQRAFGRP